MRRYALQNASGTKLVRRATAQGTSSKEIARGLSRLQDIASWDGRGSNKELHN